jgi:Ca-activated chloride channel homolog
MPVDQAYALEWQDLWYSKDQQGARALQAGQAEKASGLFENTKWTGAAQYKTEQFQQAAETFAKGQQASDHYNRGNALAKQGNFDEAKNAYDRALELDPSMDDALFNKSILEDMEKQQQNSEQNQSQNGEQSSEQQDQDQQKQNQQNQAAEQSENPDQKTEAGTEPSDKDPQDESPSQQQSSSQKNAAEDKDAKQQAQAGEPQQDTEASEQQALAEQEEDKEKQQATEQWLRRVPDDPSGLLRRKFEYESKQQDRTNNGNKIYW